MSRSGPRIAAAALLAAACAASSVAGSSRIDLRPVARAWGLDLVHHDGASGRRYLPETMGSGVVLFDFDADGDPDVFFVDGGPLPGSPDLEYGSRLLRNDGGGRFVDRTVAAGLLTPGYGTGGTAGDIEGDGDLDLYVTAYGRNLLFVNRGDGTFVEAAAKAGVADDLWAASAAFADPDRDGDLDLYVANYVDFAPGERTPCRQSGVEVYCHPGQYSGLPDRYFRNLGDGSFEEASAEAGLAVEKPHAGLAVAFADLDDDGWPDLYVANDAEPNLLFLNRGDGTFDETALLAGTAYSDGGSPEAGMGIAVGDTDGDRRLDLFVTNFELETNALYRNLGSGLFADTRFAANVAEASLMSLAFGAAFADLDHDADLDLVIANGHILDNAARFHERSRYRQPNQIFENLSGGRFRPVSGFDAGAPRVSRGLALGDLDGDGDLEIVVNNVAEAAEVYDNRGAAGAWLQVDVAAAGGDRFAIGTRLELASPSSASEAPDGAAAGVQIRELQTGSSYLSQSSLTAHFGVAAADRIDSLEARSPRGRRLRYLDLPVNRRLRLVF